nr:hypothetical protein [Candidatus Methanomethylophilus sp. 1R26]
MAVSDPVSLKSIDAIKPRQRRGTVVLADAGSISSRRFDPTFVELCKVPGNDVWLIECIETADDILDAFLPGLAKLVIPVSGIRGRGVLEEALSLSDQCVPLVSVRNGRADWGRGGPLEAVKDLADTGYGKIMVWDIGGELPTGILGVRFPRCLDNLLCPGFQEAHGRRPHRRPPARSRSSWVNSPERLRKYSLSPRSVPPRHRSPAHSEPAAAANDLNTDSTHLNDGTSDPPQTSPAARAGWRNPCMCQIQSKRSNAILMAEDGPLKCTGDDRIRRSASEKAS